MGCVYLVTNLINGDQYVGKTIETLHRRWGRHLRSAKGPCLNSYFHRAIKAYGEENFVIEVLEESEDEYYLFAVEIEAIKELDTLAPNGYNLTSGGEGGVGNKSNTGRKLTEETKKRMSEAHSKGSKHHNSRTTEEIVLEIRDKSVRGISYKDLAVEYNLSVSTIAQIVTRRTWRHI